MPDLPSPSSSRLMGWKEIGAYINKSVRTVQRWEHELGLPVHRIKTEHDGQIIFAERDELDAWMRARSAIAPAQPDPDPTTEANGAADTITAEERPATQRLRWIAGAAFAGLALLVAWTVMNLSTRSGGAEAVTPTIATAGRHPILFLLNSGIVVYDELSNRIILEHPLPAAAPFADLHGRPFFASPPRLRVHR